MLGDSDARQSVLPEEEGRRVLERRNATSVCRSLGPITSGCRAGGPRSAERRRSDGGHGEGQPGARQLAFPLRAQSQQRPDREGEDRRLRRPAARVSADRSGAAAPRPLQVHRLLRRRAKRWLAGPAPPGRRRCPRSGVHRPQPPPHGGQRRRWQCDRSSKQLPEQLPNNTTAR